MSDDITLIGIIFYSQGISDLSLRLQYITFISHEKYSW